MQHGEVDDENAGWEAWLAEQSAREEELAESYSDVELVESPGDDVPGDLMVYRRTDSGRLARKRGATEMS